MTAATNPEVERLAAGPYVSLTTYRSDGTAVPTPVWVSSDADKLYVWTERSSGKIARIRNRGHVLVAPCDSRGRLQGTPVDASARVLDDPADLARVAALHRAKYRSQFRLIEGLARVFRRGRGGHVALEITLP
jgi:PPOX class probable F420-dependent enzyme